MAEQPRDQPDAQHPYYDRALAAWQRVRDFAAGPDAIRAGGTRYLPQPPQMSEATYERMLAGAPILSAVSRTLEALLGSASQADPEVRAGSIPAAQIEDVTGAGDPLLQVSRDVLREILTVARVGVEVMPDLAGIPRWRVRPAESIISWRVSRAGGDERLERVVIALQETAPAGTWRTVIRPVLRVLLLDERRRLNVQTWRKAEGQDEKAEWKMDAPVLVPQVRGQPLDYIPLTISGGWDHIPPLPLAALVELNRAHYSISAYREYAARRVATPTPFIRSNRRGSYAAPGQGQGGKDGAPRSTSTQGQVVMGSDQLWELLADEELGFLEMKVGGLGAITDIVDERQAQMQAVGGRLVFGPSPAQETATAAAIRHAADVSVLVTATDALQEVMTAALRWHASQWSGGADISGVSFVPSREFLRPPERVDPDTGEGEDEQ